MWLRSTSMEGCHGRGSLVLELLFTGIVRDAIWGLWQLSLQVLMIQLVWKPMHAMKPSLAKDLNLRRIVIASDCQEVISNLKKGAASSYALIPTEIKDRTMEFDSVVFFI